MACLSSAADACPRANSDPGTEVKVLRHPAGRIVPNALWNNYDISKQSYGKS